MNEEKRWDKNNLQKILSIVLVIITLVTIYNMNRSIINMQQELSALRQEMNQLQSNLNSQIGGISANIEASLKKENSIISDYSYQVQSDKMNRKDKTMPLNLTVRPKEHKDGLKTTFIIETQDGKIISAQAQEGESFNYTATMKVPMKEYLKLSVSFDDGTLQKSEMLEEMYQIFDGYIMKVDSFSNVSGTYSNISSSKYKLELTGTIETTISANIDGSNFPVSGEVQIKKNGTVIKTFPIQLEGESGSGTQNEKPAQLDAVASYMAGSCITYYTELKETMNLKKNDLIEIVVIVKDNYGFQYRQTIHNERIDSKGNISPTNYSNEVVVE